MILSNFRLGNFKVNNLNLQRPLFPVRFLITFLVLGIILMLIILASFVFTGLMLALGAIGAIISGAIYGLAKAISALYKRRKKSENNQ